MKNYSVAFVFLIISFIGFSQCTIISQPLSSQVICHNEPTIPLEVITTSPSQCISVCTGQGVTTFQWLVNTTSDTIGAQSITGANSNIYIPPSNLIGQSYFFCRIFIDGCLWDYSNIVSVEIVGLPNPNLSDGVMCSGPQPYWGAYSDQIIFEPMAHSLGTFSYSWIVPTSMGDPGDVNQIFCDSEGLYTVSVTDINGCVGVDSAFITVLPASISDVSITNNSGNIFYCEGDTINLTASILNGFGSTNVADGTAVVWTTPFNQPNPGNVISFNTTIPGFYEVKVLDLNGCWSNTFVPRSFSLNPVPTVSVNSISICQGSFATLTAQTSISGGHFHWEDGSTYYGSSSSISVNPTETTTYLVYYTTSDGCEVSTSGTVTINSLTSGTDNITSCSPITWIDGNVYSSSNNTATFIIAGGAVGGCDSLVTLNLTIIPIATITAGGSTTFCEGGSVVLTSSSATGNTWSNGATTQSITVFSNGNYSVTVSNGSCSVASSPTVVTVNPSPAIPTITASGATTFCQGGSLTLTSSSATNNIWSNGATSQSITVTDNGSYSVSVSNGNCSVSSAPTVVNVNPIPSVSLTALKSFTNINSNSISLNGSPSGGV